MVSLDRRAVAWGFYLVLGCNGDTGTSSEAGSSSSSGTVMTTTGPSTVTTGATGDETTGVPTTGGGSDSQTTGHGTDHTSTDSTGDSVGDSTGDSSTGAPAPVCGDGNVDPGETCDDGNDDNTDTCVEGCKAAACGDGFVGPGESCDDGNQADDDECGNNSSFPATAPTRQLTSKLHGRNRWVFPRPARGPPTASPRRCPPGLEKSWRRAGRGREGQEMRVAQCKTRRIVKAAELLGITRHSLERRIVKRQITWPAPRDAGSE